MIGGQMFLGKVNVSSTPPFPPLSQLSLTVLWQKGSNKHRKPELNTV